MSKAHWNAGAINPASSRDRYMSGKPRTLSPVSRSLGICMTTLGFDRRQPLHHAVHRPCPLPVQGSPDLTQQLGFENMPYHNHPCLTSQAQGTFARWLSRPIRRKAPQRSLDQRTGAKKRCGCTELRLTGRDHLDHPSSLATTAVRGGCDKMVREVCGRASMDDYSKTRG